MPNPLNVLARQTQEMYDVDFTTLPFDSNQLVRVECPTCRDVFSRAFRQLNIPHDCLSDFMRKESPASYIEEYLPAVQEEAKLHQAAFELTTEFCLELAKTQQYQCFYKSGERIRYLHRLSHDLGWVPGNVVWVGGSLLHTELPRNLPKITRVEYRYSHPKARYPFRKRTTDAGYDISSVENVVIPPQTAVNINTGIQIGCPPGVYYTIEGRSGLWLEGIAPFRGIIDSGYVGDVLVCTMNIGNKPYEIKEGTRLAQLIFHTQEHVDFQEVLDFSPHCSSRGTAGFGSSGLQ